MTNRKPRIQVHEQVLDVRSEEERALDQHLGTQGHRARLQVAAGTVRRVDHVRAYDIRGRDLSPYILTLYRQQRLRYDQVSVTMATPDFPTYVMLMNNTHGQLVTYLLNRDDFAQVKGNYESHDIRINNGFTVDTRTVRTHYDLTLDLTIPFWANEFAPYIDHGFSGDPPAITQSGHPYGQHQP